MSSASSSVASTSRPCAPRSTRASCCSTGIPLKKFKYDSERMYPASRQALSISSMILEKNCVSPTTLPCFLHTTKAISCTAPMGSLRIMSSRYPDSTSFFSTRLRVPSLMPGLLLMTIETVALETPSCCAMSLILTGKSTSPPSAPQRSGDIIAERRGERNTALKYFSNLLTYFTSHGILFQDAAEQFQPPFAPVSMRPAPRGI